MDKYTFSSPQEKKDWINMENSLKQRILAEDVEDVDIREIISSEMKKYETEPFDEERYSNLVRNVVDQRLNSEYYKSNPEAKKSLLKSLEHQNYL